MTLENFRLTILAGGVGAAKLVQGMAAVSRPDTLSIISNTGDDVERHGLWISPDVDIMIYTLAGTVDTAKGWGIAGDTFEKLAALKRAGEETWFQLGDRDMETHLARTTLRREGKTPTEITRILCRKFNVSAAILPMTDGQVLTEVQTPAGWMPFQEFFVKHRCAPEILDVAFRGAESARASAEALFALRSADGIIICPSNPIASIGPILAVPGVRESLMSAAVPRIAVCPLVGGRSLKGPSDRMMKARGFSADVAGVARYYRGLVDGLVIDRLDERMAKSVLSEGIRPFVTNSVLTSIEDKSALAADCVRFLEELHENKHRHPSQKSVLC